MKLSNFFFFFNEERVHYRESGQGSTVTIILWPRAEPLAVGPPLGELTVGLASASFPGEEAGPLSLQMGRTSNSNSLAQLNIPYPVRDRVPGEVSPWDGVGRAGGRDLRQ